MATINSLGIGSGVLTADIIDQLREADESRIIKPLENKITLANQKEDAYKLLNSLMTTFKSSASALDGDNLYLSRAVTGNTDAVTVTAESGSNIQDFSITDVNLAKSDVWNSTTTIASSDTAISGLGAGTLTVSIDGEDFVIDYTATSTLNEIKDSINELAGTKMTASVLQVGTSDYELVLTAKDTNQAITFSDSNAGVTEVDTFDVGDVSGNLTGDVFTITYDGVDYDYTTLADGESAATIGDALATALAADANTTIVAGNDGTFTITSDTAGTPLAADIALSNNLAGGGTFTDSSTNTADAISLQNALGLNNIQTASAATFKYNGIEITRDTNEITDLITGVTITLNENQEINDTASIKIEQNNTSISSEISLFVNGYNSLITNLQDMTKSDRETGAVGIFNGESFVKSISRDLVNLITQVDGNGNSLMDYGIDIDRDGVMSLDNDVFAKKYVEDAGAMELFFSGDSETDGIFTKLDNKMTEYTGYNKLLSNFSDQLTDSKDSLVAQHEKQKASLDARYEIMTKRFSAYDAIISRINSQFSSLKMMIDAEANAK